MQLSLFQWDLIAVGKGYQSLARFDFDDARSRFAGVLQALPDHAEAGRGMRELAVWEEVFAEIAGLAPEAAAPLLWERISRFPFGGSEGHRALRRNLLSRLLALLEDRPEFYEPPDLCSGYLHLLLGDYAAAETHLRVVLAHWPAKGRLHAYLGDAL
ncbi:MAG: hypothetical protein AB1461_17795 [Thermodesulfobacteriota bacterium]